MNDRIIECAKKLGADLVGFAPVERFADRLPERILPGAKTVIGLGFRVLRGAYRGGEEGSTYYQYSTMGVQNVEEVVMPEATIGVARLIEDEGYVALPEKNHQRIVSTADGINPEMILSMQMHGIDNELQLDVAESARLCGLGEIGMHGKILTDEFGPFVRFAFIITDAPLTPSEIKVPHLCDRCGECIKGCPGRAISEDGEVDRWQCAAYYAGASGLKNPFMPPDAYADLDYRIELIAGEAKLTKEQVLEILPKTIFYPFISNGYISSICGRACDVNCYVHLEEKGVLTKKFKTPFRKREPWKFSIDDFK